MKLYRFFKSILDQDKSPIVVCDIHDTIVYMNSSAVKAYRKDLTGENIKSCHSQKSNEKIDKVIAYFHQNKDNNLIFIYHNESQNTDVYMVALRDDDGNLIGYYEKHECRNKETTEKYDFGK